MSDAVRARGGCLCGAVRYAIRGPLRAKVTACHCRTCRRFSGGIWTGTAVERKSLVFERDEGLKWFRSSEHARRGFCAQCGSSLFWEADDEPFMSLAAGSIDEPTGLTLATHSWLEEDADFWRFGSEVALKQGPSGLGFPELGVPESSED